MNNLKKILDNLVSYEHANLFRNKDTKIKLLKDKVLGIKVVCVKPIKKNETIAYYKIMVHDEKTYKPYKNSMYAMDIISKKGNSRNTLIGDIYPGSLELPGKDNISYYGFFCNEPNLKQKANCYINPELKLNYSKRDVVKVGDTMIYTLKASCNIEKGEDITWCYGSLYSRNYKVHPGCLED